MPENIPDNSETSRAPDGRAGALTQRATPLFERAVELAYTLRDRSRAAGRAAMRALHRARHALQERRRRTSDGPTPILHLVPYDTDWAVHRQGARRSYEVFGTREHALERARHLAEESRCILIVHRHDGQVEAEIDCTVGPLPHTPRLPLGLTPTR